MTNKISNLIILLIILIISSIACNLEAKNAQDYVEEGNLMNLVGDRENALVCYRKATQIDPYCLDAWHNIGFVEFLCKRYNESLKAYNMFIEINPNDPSVWAKRAFTLGLMGKIDDAYASYQRAIDLDSSYKNKLVELEHLIDTLQ